jgi:putative hydrolase of HD superfamily
MTSEIPDRHVLHGAEPEHQVLVSFLALAHGLTAVDRLNRLLDGSRQENSAEHSWHVGLCALVLAPHLAPELDIGRVLEILTIHDLVEIEVGDVPIYDTAARATQEAAERAAALRLFPNLPYGSRLLALWEDFEGATSDEARYARAIDRLQPMLIHWAGGGRVWRERGTRRETLDGLVALAGAFWPPVGRLAEAIIADAARRGDLAP